MLDHEATHVKQLNDWLYWKNRAIMPSNRHRLEAAAYRAQCETSKRQQCLEPGTRRYRREVDKCIADFFHYSTESEYVKKIQELCAERIPPGWTPV